MSHPDTCTASDGITVGSRVVTSPTGFFRDPNVWIVTAHVEPSTRPGLFPTDPEIVNTGSITAHMEGDPSTVVTLARPGFMVFDR